MPIRTHRGRSAVYRRLWSWPLTSYRHLAVTFTAVAVLAVLVSLTLAATTPPPTPQPRTAGAPATSSDNPPTQAPLTTPHTSASHTKNTTAAPQQVCEQFAQSYLDSDARKDTSPADARRRAAQRYGTATLQQQPAGTDTRPDPRWQEWAAHHAWITTTPQHYRGDKPPPDSPTRKYRATTISRHVVSDTQWNQPLPPVHVYCTLTAADSGEWKVHQADINISRG